MPPKARAKRGRPVTIWLQADTHQALDHLSNHLHTSKREVIERLIIRLERDRVLGRLEGLDFVLHQPEHAGT